MNQRAIYPMFLAPVMIVRVEVESSSISISYNYSPCFSVSGEARFSVISHAH